LAYKSYKKEVLNAIKTCKKEFCEGIGVLAVAEVQPLVPVLSGNLKKCVVSEVMDKNEGVYIGVTKEAPYGIMVEKGTSKQSAQPYLEPGANNAIPKIINVATKVYKQRMGK
jgi:HK97 gp10 family phage protein